LCGIEEEAEAEAGKLTAGQRRADELLNSFVV